MKKMISVLLAVALMISMISTVSAMTVLSSQGLSVDGKAVNCEKYNIDGSNYFKLRDIAYLLNGTKCQFAVGWDAASQTISLLTKEAYAANGSELDLSGGDKSATAKPSKQALKIDGKTITGLSVYNIGGNNYFKLRDLGDALGFTVGYDEATRTATVKSEKPATYTQQGLDYQVWVNKAWLEKMGLTAPTTIFELPVVLRAFRDKDPNGNGKLDEIPMIGTKEAMLSYLMSAFIPFDAKGRALTVNEKTTAAYHTEEYRDALRFANSLMNEALLSTLTFTSPKSEVAEIATMEELFVGIIAGDKGMVANDPRWQLMEPLSDATGMGGYKPKSLSVVQNGIPEECSQYIMDRCAQFSTGILDISDDNEWKQYLSGLDALGYRK